MSLDASKLVWRRSRHGGTELLILLALADRSDDHGRSFPSVADLAEKCRITPRHATRVLKELQAAGEVAIELNAGPKGKNVYRLLFEGMTRMSGDDAGVRGDTHVRDDAPVRLTPRAGGDDTHVLYPLTPVSAEPSINHQEPPKAPRKRASSVSAVPVPDWMPADAWASYVRMRASMRNPFSAEAQHLTIKQLEKFKAAGHNVRDVIETSVIRGWSGLFEPKGAPRGKDAGSGADATASFGVDFGAAA